VQEFETPRAGSQASGSGRSDIAELKKLVKDLAKEVHDMRDRRSFRDQSVGRSTQKPGGRSSPQSGAHLK